LPRGVVRQGEGFLNLERTFTATPVQQDIRGLQADGEIDRRRGHEDAARFRSTQRANFRRGHGAVGEAEAAEIDGVGVNARGVAFVKEQQIVTGIIVGIDRVAPSMPALPVKTGAPLR
jgi:hypothetical protein